ncbi:MAG: hypothetical protein GW858_13275 [Sphingomonadales bacterium]|nr:hypothetical protein [Sphingomonadales bacterium]NCQ22128.1 hypothetical protein [Sphingomonadales bacterium]NCT03389.1 hypothetical protein [Sphingomonadales bacterium]
MQGPYGLLTFEVDEVVKGSVPAKVQLAWYNSTFGLLESMAAESARLVAAVQVDPAMPGPALRVLQSPCAPPFLLDDTPQNRAHMHLAQRGAPVPPHDYFVNQRIEMEQAPSRPQTVRFDPAEPAAATREGAAALGGLAALLAGIGLIGWRLACRRS